MLQFPSLRLGYAPWTELSGHAQPRVAGLEKGMEAGLRREAVNFGELTQSRESKGMRAW